MHIKNNNRTFLETQQKMLRDSSYSVPKMQQHTIFLDFNSDSGMNTAEYTLICDFHFSWKWTNRKKISGCRESRLLNGQLPIVYKISLSGYNCSDSTQKDPSLSHARLYDPVVIEKSSDIGIGFWSQFLNPKTISREKVHKDLFSAGNLESI